MGDIVLGTPGVTVLSENNGTVNSTINGNATVNGKINNPGLEYLSVIWPNGVDDTYTWSSDFGPSSSLADVSSNVLSYSYYGNGTDPESAEFSITGLTTGLWFISATYTHDRTYTNSPDNIFRLQLWEGASGNPVTDSEFGDTHVIAMAESYGSDDRVGSTSFSVIRNYLSGVPSSVIIEFENDHTSYLKGHGNTILIYRVG